MGWMCEGGQGVSVGVWVWVWVEGWDGMGMEVRV